MGRPLAHRRGVLGGLWVVTLIAFGALGIARARRAAREAVEAAESAAPSARADRPARPGRPAGQAPGDENLPAYMRPGFREEIEARRRMELEGLAADT